MPTPNDVARVSPQAPWRRELDAVRAENRRQNRLDEIAEARGRVTESKTYAAARRSAGLG